MDLENYKNKITKDNKNEKNLNLIIEKKIKEYKNDLETNNIYWVLEHKGWGTPLSNWTYGL